MTPFAIRRLTPDDAEAFARLRREALEREPLAFGSSPEDDRARSLSSVREILRPDGLSAAFGAFGPEGLVGTVGIGRETKKKSAHKAHLWGVYVGVRHRRAGIGVALLEAALGHARRLDGVTHVHLSVSDRARPAERLYERLGFRRWGTEPEALRWRGETASEHYMVLRL